MTGKEVLDILEKRAAKYLRGARAFIEKGDFYAENHDWLQQHAVGYGIDIASGSFPTMLKDGSAPVICVDGQMNLGNIFDGFISDASKLVAIQSGSLDFVVSNYLDGMHYPIQCLNEWYRVLKPNGTIALITANSDADRYTCRYGPLKNPRRVNLFTQRILRFYLERAEFNSVEVSIKDHQLLAKAVK